MGVPRLAMRSSARLASQHTHLQPSHDLVSAITRPLKPKSPRLFSLDTKTPCPLLCTYQRPSLAVYQCTGSQPPIPLFTDLIPTHSHLTLTPMCPSCHRCPSYLVSVPHARMFPPSPRASKINLSGSCACFCTRSVRAGGVYVGGTVVRRTAPKPT